jgi:hypothetical protein
MSVIEMLGALASSHLLMLVVLTLLEYQYVCSFNLANFSKF